MNNLFPVNQIIRTWRESKLQHHYPTCSQTGKENKRVHTMYLLCFLAFPAIYFNVRVHTICLATKKQKENQHLHIHKCPELESQSYLQPLFFFYFFIVLVYVPKNISEVLLKIQICKELASFLCILSINVWIPANYSNFKLNEAGFFNPLLAGKP